MSLGVDERKIGRSQGCPVDEIEDPQNGRGSDPSVDGRVPAGYEVIEGEGDVAPQAPGKVDVEMAHVRDDDGIGSRERASSGPEAAPPRCQAGPHGPRPPWLAYERNPGRGVEVQRGIAFDDLMPSRCQP